jgi:hypothetical protein
MNILAWPFLQRRSFGHLIRTTITREATMDRKSIIIVVLVALIIGCAAGIAGRNQGSRRASARGSQPPAHLDFYLGIGLNTA